MFLGSTIIEVAIGIVFVYILLSLICSAINEWIAGIFRLRSSFLRSGITNLLDDPAMNKLGYTLAEDFFKHPLIKAMSQKGWARLYTKERTPSYISASTFARVLIDLLPASPSSASSNVDSNAQTPVEPRALIDIYQAARQKLLMLKAEGSPLARTLLLLIDDAGINSSKIATVTETTKALNQARKQLTDLLQTVEAAGGQGDVKTLLENIKNLETYSKQLDAELTGALLQAQRNVEIYFDEMMERVTGWYKRYVQLIIVAIAFVVSLILNADSIAIANTLMVNNTLRSTVVAAAENSMSDLEAALKLVNGDFISSTVSLSGTVTVSETNSAPAGEANEGAVNGDLDALQMLKWLGLPLGWGNETIPTGGKWFSWFLIKLIGLLVTTAAASMGAPFWFDLLNKLINLRMAGKKPSETQTGTQR